MHGSYVKHNTFKSIFYVILMKIYGMYTVHIAVFEGSLGIMVSEEMGHTLLFSDEWKRNTTERILTVVQPYNLRVHGCILYYILLQYILLYTAHST